MFIDITLFIVSIVSFYTDLVRKKIYNNVLLPAVILALGYHFYTGGPAGIIFSIQGLALGLALLFLFYTAGGIGAGDVKLLGTIGALKGPVFVFNTFLAGSITGGLLAIIALIKNKELITAFKIPLRNLLPVEKKSSREAVLKNIRTEETSIPYGAAIVTGAFVAYFVR